MWNAVQESQMHKHSEKFLVVWLTTDCIRLLTLTSKSINIAAKRLICVIELPIFTPKIKHMQ